MAFPSITSDKPSFLVTHRTPDAVVYFYPYLFEDESKIQSDSEGLMSNLAVEVRCQSDIMSVTTSKPKNGIGAFNIVLAPGSDWGEILFPGCWCAIYISPDPIEEGGQLSLDPMGTSDSEDQYLKMVGVIKSVQRQEILTETGIKAVRYSISGDDFQAVFNSQIYINAVLSDTTSPGDPNHAVLTLSPSFFQPMSPDAMVKILLKDVFGIGFAGVSRVGVQIKIPSDLSKRITGDSSNTSFLDFVSMHIQEDLLGLATAPVVTGHVGFWSLLQSMSNPLINEIYCDLHPVEVGNVKKMVPSLIMRAQPLSHKPKPHSQCILEDSYKDIDSSSVFTASKGSGADTYFMSRSIPESEILGLSIGKTDGERFNFFYVPGRIVNQQDVGEAMWLSSILSAEGDLNSISNKGSVSRHGVRLFNQVSNYGVHKEKESVTLYNEIAKDMWSSAYLYKNGMVSVIGSQTHIPVGSIVYLEDRDLVGLVESVENSFSVGPDGTKDYRTNISMTRMKGKGLNVQDGKVDNQRITYISTNIPLSKSSGHNVEIAIDKLKDFRKLKDGSK